jgi:alpha-beta hydrolase superfamily lysophospholipase
MLLLNSCENLHRLTTATFDAAVPCCLYCHHKPNSGSLTGIMQEMQLCTERSSPLHLNYLQDVTAPTRVYMGTADAVMLHSHVQHWAANARAGNVELISVEGGTHDGLMHTHRTAALEALAADLEQQQQ